MKRITDILRNNIISAGIAALFVIIPYLYASADIVSLSDGSVMNGKIIENTDSELIFVNSYGTFKIEKVKIAKYAETTSYKEDLAIRKQMGLKADEETVKRNYLAGEAEKEKIEAKKNSARISLNIFGSYTFGDLNEVLPLGYGFTIDYEHNLFKSYDLYTIPWIRLEGGYTIYKKDTCRVNGYNISAGPMWLIPLYKDLDLKLIVSVLPGISFLDIDRESTGYKANSNTFTLNSLIGVEIPYGRYGFSLLGRYSYIYDKDVSFNNLGIAAGLSYLF